MAAGAAKAAGRTARSSAIVGSCMSNMDVKVDHEMFVWLGGRKLVEVPGANQQYVCMYVCQG